MPTTARAFVAWHVGIQWYLAVLVGYPVARLLSGRAAGLAGIAQVGIPQRAHFYGALIPALLTDSQPDAGSDLGVVAPAFFISGMPQKQMALPVFFFNTISRSIADTWLYQRARGNLQPPILVHLITNHYSTLLHFSYAISVAGATLVALAVLQLGGMRSRRRTRAQLLADAEGSSI